MELLAVLAVPLSSAHYIRSHFPRKRVQLLGVQHYVPILPLLHPAQRALSCCPVAGQLGGSRPGKIENNRMAKKKNSPFGLFFSLVSGSYLSSRAVASQVLSAYKGLTSVFGMGTGGTPWLNHRNGYGVFSTHLENCIAFQFASIKPSTY